MGDCTIPKVESRSGGERGELGFNESEASSIWQPNQHAPASRFWELRQVPTCIKEKELGTCKLAANPQVCMFREKARARTLRSTPRIAPFGLTGGRIEEATTETQWNNIHRDTTGTSRMRRIVSCNNVFATRSVERKGRRAERSRSGSNQPWSQSHCGNWGKGDQRLSFTPSALWTVTP